MNKHFLLLFLLSLFQVALIANDQLTMEMQVCKNSACLIEFSDNDLLDCAEGYQYKWDRSNTLESESWENIEGENEPRLEIASVSENMYYRRVAVCGEENTVRKIVFLQIIELPEILEYNFLQTICYNMPPNPLLVKILPSNVQIIGYKWEYSLDKNSWTDMGINAELCAISKLKSTTYYRCTITTDCGSVISEIAEITVYNEFNTGEISNGQKEIYLKETPSDIISLSAPSGGLSPYEYRWKCNNIVIPNKNGETYIPDNYSTPGSYLYTREVKDKACSQWQVSEGAWLLIVNPNPPTPPVPEKPHGAISLCRRNDEINIYELTTEINMPDVKYIWQLDKPDAGTILKNGDSSVAIRWNNAFSGTVNLKVKAKIGENESDFSEGLEIKRYEIPQIKFTQAPNPVCANQKNLLYKIEKEAKVTYKWTVKNGTIVSENGNEILVNWGKDKQGTTGEINVIATAENGCTETFTLPIAISTDVAIDLNQIVGKKNEKDEPYILIYPNPQEGCFFQWYRDGNAIDGADESFFHAQTFGFSLNDGAQYNVFVGNLDNTSCGNFSELYTALEPEEKTVKNFSFKLWPNPVVDEFRISFNQTENTNPSEKALLRVYSLSGLKIYEEEISTSADYVFNKYLNKGVYFIQVMIEEHASDIQRIIVE